MAISKAKRSAAAKKAARTRKRRAAAAKAKEVAAGAGDAVRGAGKAVAAGAKQVAGNVKDMYQTGEAEAAAGKRKKQLLDHIGQLEQLFTQHIEASPHSRLAGQDVKNLTLAKLKQALTQKEVDTGKKVGPEVENRIALLFARNVEKNIKRLTNRPTIIRM